MSERDQNPEVEEPIDTNAAPTIVAFTFQFERALYSLFLGHAKRTQVGLETLDDVAELTWNADGSVDARLEQDANTVQSAGQPFQDSSYKLWHTLRVWLSHVKVLREKYADVQFCLVTNTKVPEKALARVLSDAKSDEQVKAAVSALRAQAQVVVTKKKSRATANPASKPKTSTKKSSSAKTEAEAVLNHDDNDLSYLVRGLELLDDGGTSSVAQPREATIELFQLPSALVEHGEEVYRYLLGIVVDTCRKAWTAGEIVWLSPQVFRDHLHNERDRRFLYKYLDRPMMHVDFKNLVTRGGREFFFLKQLSRLDIPPRIIDRHLEKFWAFYVERVRLEKEGFNQVDWEAREDSLHQRWEDCRDNAVMESMMQASATPEQIGVRTLTKTLDENFKAPLGRHETGNSYFTHGHYHQMANEPDGRFFVYWHPEYGSRRDADDEGGS
ncbi:ABC-three component system protein [Burkholderia cenocepacia]|uniref:ABC-three component system protein n=1 Tax=Burkholderia cenocepacia TaxID=95486 RepID=UPI00396B3C0D